MQRQVFFLKIQNLLNLATLNYKKNDEVGRKKDNPFPVQSCDYTYTNGDELWIYSDGGAGVFAFSFTGKIDKDFVGSEPNQVSKEVRKAQK